MKQIAGQFNYIVLVLQFIVNIMSKFCHYENEFQYFRKT